jgi:hypothetical protein
MPYWDKNLGGCCFGWKLGESWKTTDALKVFRNAKFKQRTYTRKQDLSTLEDLEVGACAVLSIDWIKQHMQNQSAAGGEVRTQQLARTNWVAADQRANAFNNTGSAGEGTYRRPVAVAVTSNISTKAADGAGIQTPNRATLLGYLDAVTGRYYVIIMNLLRRGGTRSTGHMCSAYQSGTHLTFFDANSGEYYVANASRTSFLLALEAQYGTYVTPGGESQPRTVTQWEAYRLT